jgi:hypothetical protein
MTGRTLLRTLLRHVYDSCQCNLHTVAFAGCGNVQKAVMGSRVYCRLNLAA